MTSHARDLFWIRRLVWTYFFLWIFEGALRKWFLSPLAGPLLLVRDPVVLAIYFLAWRSRRFPNNAFIRIGAGLAFAFFVAGILASQGTIGVTIYGLRADFFHLPLIFIIAQVFEADDVRRIGYWTLLLSIPMALLMILQFLAPSNSWINSGADNNFQQLQSALGHIRAPGTFTFISGPVYYYSFVAAFLLYSQFLPNLYPVRLTVSATLATLMAAVVSGSRSLTLAISVVFVVALVSGSFLRPRLVFRWLGCLVGLLLVVYFLNDVSIFREGVGVFNARINRAAQSEGGNEGLIARFLGDYLNAWPTLFDSPVLGYGLGMGTAVGSALLTGKVQYLLAESEWSRVILESGPFLGGSFLFLRVSLALWSGMIALRCMAQRDPLAVLIFGASFTPLINGNLGQTTSLGFAVFSSGCCLAATRTSRRVSQPVVKPISKPLANTAVSPSTDPAFS